jgi:hypothetical protein
MNNHMLEEALGGEAIAYDKAISSLPLRMVHTDDKDALLVRRCKVHHSLAALVERVRQAVRPSLYEQRDQHA